MQRDELLRRHVGQQLPERLALGLRPQIPDRVDDGGGGQVDDALLRADPAQLAVAGDHVPERAHVGGNRLQRLAHDQRCERLDRRHADLVAAADGEGQAVAFQFRIGLQHDIGGRVIRRGVHRVGAVERARGREADVADERSVIWVATFALQRCDGWGGNGQRIGLAAIRIQSSFGILRYKFRDHSWTTPRCLANPPRRPVSAAAHQKPPDPAAQRLG